MPGDEFALRQDGLFCRHDHDVLEGGKHCSGPGGVPGSENNNNASLMNNNHHLHPNDGSISGKGTKTFDRFCVSAKGAMLGWSIAVRRKRELLLLLCVSEGLLDTRGVAVK